MKAEGLTMMINEDETGVQKSIIIKTKRLTLKCAYQERHKI